MFNIQNHRIFLILACSLTLLKNPYKEQDTMYVNYNPPSIIEVTQMIQIYFKVMKLGYHSKQLAVLLPTVYVAQFLLNL